jgi:hypothetical protein
MVPTFSFLVPVVVFLALAYFSLAWSPSVFLLPSVLSHRIAVVLRKVGWSCTCPDAAGSQFLVVGVLEMPLPSFLYAIVPSRSCQAHSFSRSAIVRF